MLKTSIIIRVLNEGEHIGKLLYGLSQQSQLPDEIIIVDSGSTDNTLEIAAKFDCRVVHISKECFTFGRALNLGCSIAKNDILIFLSGHVYPVHEDWLERIIYPFKYENVVSTYGKQRGNSKSRFSEHQIFSSWFPENVNAVKTNYFCNNANCAIRKSSWNACPYDEELTGLEDLDWAKKQTKLGKKIIYTPQAEIIHFHNENWKQIRNRYLREAIALRKIEPKMSVNALSMSWLILVSIITDISAAKSLKKFCKHFVSILIFRFNQYYGTYKGFRTKSSEIDKLHSTFYYPMNKSDIKFKKESNLKSNMFKEIKRRQKINYPKDAINK